MAKLLKRKMEAFEWFGLTPQERFNQKLPFNRIELAEHLRIDKKTLAKWGQEYDALQLAKQEEANVIETYDSDAWLRSRTKEADIALMKACASGNAQALKLFNQLINRLVEKQEVRVGLTADEIAGRNFEADRELQEWHRHRGEMGQGVEEMQEKPSLLSQ